jgi:hypothetical protein
MSNKPKTNIEMDKRQFQKIMFIHNAIEQGWSVKKSTDSDSYIFIKKHENRREIFSANYLENFIRSNMTLL